MVITSKNIISGTGLALAAVLFVAVIILANVTLTSWRLDLTGNKLFTLSEGTLNILDSLEEPVTLDFYFSQKALVGYPLLINYGARVRDLLQEYEAHSNGMLQLRVIDLESFSEEEDKAVASGLQSISVNTEDRAYLGLIGTNSVDDEKVIPFFQSSKESALEYDITKLVYNLAYPKKRVVGIISSLPIFGDTEQNLPQWSIVDTIRELFEIRDLGAKPSVITGVDVLLLIHPKDLENETLFAIDQYVLQGGKAMVFIDPLSEVDSKTATPDSTGAIPDLDSDVVTLMEQWGAVLIKEKVSGDINTAMYVQTQGGRGPREISYLPWMRLAKEHLNQTDFATRGIKVINLGSVGIIEKKVESNIEFIPLVQTTKKSMQMERDLVLFQRDPQVFLDNFKAEGKKHTLAVRLQGQAKTAFPEGLVPEEEEDNNTDKNDRKPPVEAAELTDEGYINIIIVADTDLLDDIFWIRTNSYFGMNIRQTIANNADFVINALENLSGSHDLASLRTRGESSRPFERVEAIRRQAELEFSEREQKLNATLRETEQKIRQLQRERDQDSDGGNIILTPEQSEEIRKFQQVRIDTRKQLRAVRHELRKNIESLGAKLRFFNIAFVPLLIILIVVGTGVYKMARYR